MGVPIKRVEFKENVRALSRDTELCVIRDGPLEKLWGGEGNFREFLFVIKFLV